MWDLDYSMIWYYQMVDYSDQRIYWNGGETRTVMVYV